jgi:hypothetical protein
MVRCNFTPHAIRSWRARSQTAHEFMGPLQIMEKIHRDFTERPKARRRPGETTHVTVSGGGARGAKLLSSIVDVEYDTISKC